MKRTDWRITAKDIAPYFAKSQSSYLFWYKLWRFVHERGLPIIPLVTEAAQVRNVSHQYRYDRFKIAESASRAHMLTVSIPEKHMAAAISRRQAVMAIVDVGNASGLQQRLEAKGIPVHMIALASPSPLLRQLSNRIRSAYQSRQARRKKRQQAIVKRKEKHKRTPFK